MLLIGFTTYLEVICIVSLVTASLLGTDIIHCCSLGTLCSLNLVEYRVPGRRVTTARGLTLSVYWLVAGCFGQLFPHTFGLFIKRGTFAGNSLRLLNTFK
jgi:hypothetical protein